VAAACCDCGQPEPNPQTSDVQAHKPPLPHRVPAVRKLTRRGVPAAGAIRRVHPNSGSAWTISLSNSSTAIVLGSIYGLIAIGYTMVYGIVGMINFAHGDIFMIGGFIALITFLILVSIGLTVVPVILHDRAFGVDGDHGTLRLDRWSALPTGRCGIRSGSRRCLSAIGMSFVPDELFARLRRARG